VESKVMNLFIADETGSTKCVIWDVNQIKLFEDGKIKEGDVIEIKDATIRENFGGNGLEVHVGSMSLIALSAEKMDNVSTVQKADVQEAKLAMLTENMRANVRAVIVQVFEPKFFMVCPECGKKVVNEGDHFKCQTHNNVIPSERSLITLTIDDSTANMKAVGFSEVVKKIFGVQESEIRGITPEKRNELLGKEMIFSGRARKNPMFNHMEFLLSDVEEVNLDSLIQKLQK
jgi:Replication factor-A C terminal domain/OB-fold nucleic acid binding domain